MKCSICSKTLVEGDHCYVLSFCTVMENEDYERKEDAIEVYCTDCAYKLKLDQNTTLEMINQQGKEGDQNG